MKGKIKDVSFWISVGSAVLLIISVLTDNFGIEKSAIVEIYSCILALLTTLGVLTKSENVKQSSEEVEQIKEEIQGCLEENGRQKK